jgi:hypothetical protein
MQAKSSRCGNRPLRDTTETEDSSGDASGLEGLLKDLALFDFDGTITVDPTYPEFVRFAVHPGRKLGGGIILAPLILAYRLGLLSDRRIRWAISRVAFWGDDPVRLRRLGANDAREVLPRLIRPEAVERIESETSPRSRKSSRTVLVAATFLNSIPLHPMSLCEPSNQCSST